jgi:predicted transposase/invertase (TIGR01784 family)
MRTVLLLGQNTNPYTLKRLEMKKDIIGKEITKRIGIDLAKYLLGIDLDGDSVELIDKEFTRIEKRESDILLKCGTIIMHIEIQNNNQTYFALRMMRYLTDILFEYPDATVHQMAVYIGKEACRLQDNLHIGKSSYHYTLIDTRDLDCERFLQSQDPEAVVLAILCNLEGKDKAAIARQILHRLLELSGDDLQMFNRYLTMVEELSGNRDLRDEIEEAEKMYKVNVEKHPSYNLGIEAGMRQGIQQGLQKGRQEGIEQGVLGMFGMGIGVDAIAKAMGISVADANSIIARAKH